jgi:hypothetical protein
MFYSGTSAQAKILLLSDECSDGFVEFRAN